MKEREKGDETNCPFGSERMGALAALTLRT